MSRYIKTVNSRKILSGVAEILGVPDQENLLCIAMDKVDKVGLDGMSAYLAESGFRQVSALRELLDGVEGSCDPLASLDAAFVNTVVGQQGVQDVRRVLSMVGENSGAQFDLTLARGFSYYTGAVFEVSIEGSQVGSVSGGGRYDNLTAGFGGQALSGVGVSFGIDRLVDAMDTLGLFPKLDSAIDVLVTAVGDVAPGDCLPLLCQLRSAGLVAEIYPESAGMKKQLTYAAKRNAKYAIAIGADEVAGRFVSLRTMADGQVSKVSIDDAISDIRGG